MHITTSANGRRALKAFFGLLVLFLYAPLVILVIFSFNDSTLPAFPLEGFTTRWYEQFIANPELKDAIKTSAIIAAFASTISVTLGMLASIALVRRRFLGKPAVSALLLSPLVIPYVALGISLLILFSRLKIELSIWTIVIGHVVIILPFTILILAPRLEKIDVRLEEAAHDLGAGGLRTFRSITLPLTLPAIVSALLISFVISFDEFGVAVFVAGTETTFPIYLFSQLRFPQLLPQAIAVAVCVLAASMTLALAAEVGRRVAERRLDAALETPEQPAPASQVELAK